MVFLFFRKTVCFTVLKNIKDYLEIYLNGIRLKPSKSDKPFPRNRGKYIKNSYALNIESGPHLKSVKNSEALHEKALKQFYLVRCFPRTRHSIGLSWQKNMCKLSLEIHCPIRIAAGNTIQRQQYLVSTGKLRSGTIFCSKYNNTYVEGKDRRKTYNVWVKDPILANRPKNFNRYATCY